MLLDQLLHQEFGDKLIAHVSLPPKRAFGNLQPQFVEERRVALERYLQLCLAVAEVASSSTFCTFLEADVPGVSDFAQLTEPGAVMGRACTKQGYLLKRSRRLASWNRRCFCLCDGMVTWPSWGGAFAAHHRLRHRAASDGLGLPFALARRVPAPSDRTEMPCL